VPLWLAERHVRPCRCGRSVVLGDATFDLVYTGGHVALWVSALQPIREALAFETDDLLIVSEYHPFRRVWRRSSISLEIRFITRSWTASPLRGRAGCARCNAREWEQFYFAGRSPIIFGRSSRPLSAHPCREFGDTSEEWEVHR